MAMIQALKYYKGNKREFPNVLFILKGIKNIIDWRDIIDQKEKYAKEVMTENTIKAFEGILNIRK